MLLSYMEALTPTGAANADGRRLVLWHKAHKRDVVSLIERLEAEPTLVPFSGEVAFSLSRLRADVGNVSNQDLAVNQWRQGWNSSHLREGVRSQLELALRAAESGNDP